MKTGFLVIAICIPLFNILVYCFAALLEWHMVIMLITSVVGSIVLGGLMYKLALKPFQDRYETMERTLAAVNEREEIRKAFVSDISEALKKPASNLNNYLREIVNIVKMRKNSQPIELPELKKKEPEEVSRYARLYDIRDTERYDEPLSKKNKVDVSSYHDDLMENTVPKALSEVEKLVKLMDDLIVLLDVEKKNHISQGGKIDIEKVIIESTDEFNSILEEKKIDIIIDIEDNLYIEGAAERFKILICKILDNAIRYSNSGKTISINGDNINGYIVVSIKDEGLGISAEDQPKIFDRFYRGINSATYNPMGSGLGLSIAKHLAYLLDAEIKVKTAYGEGSTFSIIFKRGL